MRHPLFLLGLTAVACSPQKRLESGQSTDSAVVEPDPGTADVWGAVYDGSDPSVPFLPDAHARYWRYAFERPPTGTALLLDGALSDVRYQAVDVYDDDTRTSLGAVRDTALNGMLRLWVADPEDLANLDGPGLPLPAGATALFLRMYDPEGRVAAPALPRVSVVDLATGAFAAPPARVEPAEIPQSLIDSVMARHEIAQREDRVDFYRIEGAGLYAAADNDYLVAQITRAPDEVVALRFQPPTHATAPESSAEVRYWSLTQCDRQSYCHHTLADLEVSLSDGMAEVVIGDDDPALRAAAGDRTFVPWSTPGDEMVLVYRNLATVDGVAHAIDSVPVFDSASAVEGQEATATLGSRAPGGTRCARTAFIDGTCGQ